MPNKDQPTHRRGCCCCFCCFPRKSQSSTVKGPPPKQTMDGSDKAQTAVVVAQVAATGARYGMSNYTAKDGVLTRDLAVGSNTFGMQEQEHIGVTDGNYTEGFSQSWACCCFSTKESRSSSIGQDGLQGARSSSVKCCCMECGGSEESYCCSDKGICGYECTQECCGKDCSFECSTDCCGDCIVGCCSDLGDVCGSLFTFCCDGENGACCKLWECGKGCFSCDCISLPSCDCLSDCNLDCCKDLAEGVGSLVCGLLSLCDSD